MANIKTAISIRESLFRQAESLARAMAVSRSQLFTMALEDFIGQHENQQLLQRLNTAYDDMPGPAEQEYRQRRKEYHRHMVEGEW